MSLKQKCSNCKYEHLNKFYNDFFCIKEDLISFKKMNFEPSFEDEPFILCCRDMNDSNRCLYYKTKKWKFWIRVEDGVLS